MSFLSNNIKQLRIQKGLTQDDLAKIVGKTRSLISAWESDDREITTSDVAKLSEYFNISMDKLVGSDLASSPEYELEQEIYFNKFKELSPRDREIVKGVIDSIIKEIDEKDK